jgi:glycerol kinase
MPDLILAIDQGTTSSRAIVFDRKLKPIGIGQQEFRQFFPASGWVEHDPEEIWSSGARHLQGGAEQGQGEAAQPLPAIGITNQRETVVVWDRKTGKPIHKAIVWQDRRTADDLRGLKEPRATSRSSPARPACCSTPISPAPRSRGCSTT